MKLLQENMQKHAHTHKHTYTIHISNFLTVSSIKLYHQITPTWNMC